MRFLEDAKSKEGAGTPSEDPDVVDAEIIAPQVDRTEKVEKMETPIPPPQEPKRPAARTKGKKAQ